MSERNIMRGMIIQPHRDGCWAVGTVARGDWSHPWGPARTHGLEREWTGKPHPGASTRFLVYICNDPACPAEMIFLASVLERFLGIRPRTGDKTERRMDEFWHKERDCSWEWAVENEE